MRNEVCGQGVVRKANAILLWDKTRQGMRIEKEVTVML